MGTKKNEMKAILRGMGKERRKAWKKHIEKVGFKVAWNHYHFRNEGLGIGSGWVEPSEVKGPSVPTTKSKGDSTGNKEKPHHLRQVAQWLSQQYAPGNGNGIYMLQFDGEELDKTRIPLYLHPDGNWYDNNMDLIWDPKADPIPDEVKSGGAELIESVDGVIDEALAKTVYEGAPKLGLGQFAIREQFGTKVHEGLEKYLGIYDGLPETALWDNPVLDGLQTSAVADWPKAFTIENDKVIIHPEAYRPDSDRTLERVLQRVNEMISDMAQRPPMAGPMVGTIQEGYMRLDPENPPPSTKVEMGVNDQPKPKPNDGASIHDLVIADVQQRKDFGLEKYGTLLQAGNLRDAIKDSYEEILDHVCYMRAYLEETKDAVVLTRDVAEAIERTLRVLAVEANKAADTADVMYFGKDPEGAPSAEEMHADRVSLAHSLILQAVSPKKGTDQKD